MTVSKTKHDLKIVCNKDGYQTATATIVSKFHATTFGNVIAGGIIGVGVDAATGAMFEFPKSYQVTMVPVAAATLQVPAAIPGS